MLSLNRNDVLVSLVVIGLVALLWVITFWINTWLDPVFFEHVGVSWVFLPAGIRLLSVAVFRWDGVFGLSVGTLVTSIALYDDTLLIVGTAILSGLAPMLALQLLERARVVNTDLRAITPLGIISMCFVFAALNTALGQGFFLLQGTTSLSGVLAISGAMFTGDLVGALIVISLFSLALRLRSKQEPGQDATQIKV